MLCKCQIPSREVRANPPFFTCGYYPQRCKMFASRPLIAAYGGALTNLTPQTKDRFVAFELALSPASATEGVREEAFYVKPLNPNDPVLKALLNDSDRWPGVLFSARRQQWLFPIADYKEVLTAVKALQPSYAVYEVPGYIFDFIQRANTRCDLMKKELYAEEERRTLRANGGGDPKLSSPVAGDGFVSTAGYTVPDWAKAGAAAAAAPLPHPNMPTDADPLFRQLKPFQKEGVTYVLEHNGRAMIADEMGLGKTVQAICAAQCYNAEWPVLVMCPGSLCDNWAKEFSKWLLIPRSRIHIVRAASQMKKSDGRLDLDIASVVIVGYQNLKHLPIGIDFKVVILDECHFIKNPTSQRTKEAQVICNKANRTILLSGTPAMSRPYELLPQLHLIAGVTVDTTRHGHAARFLADFQYSSRYCGGHFTNAAKFGPPRPNHSGHSNTDELHMILKHFIIRRCKKDVLGDMPSKSRKCLYLRVTERELKSLETSVTAFKKEMGKAGGADALFKGGGAAANGASLTAGVGGMGASLQLKVQTAKAKVPAVKDYLKEVFEELVETNEEIAADNAEFASGGGGGGGGDDAASRPKKIIVFAHHLELLNAAAQVAEAALSKKGYEYIRIAGETSIVEREALCNRFREKPKCAVAVLSMQAMGTGHNLTCASKVIFTELDWNPSTHLQCEDRVHRIGQEEECLIQYLLADGTADEVVWPLLQEKIDVTLAMIAGSRNDTVVLGGAGVGGAPQDKEVVRRKDTTVTGGVCGGSATLDAWMVRTERPRQPSVEGVDNAEEQSGDGDKAPAPLPPPTPPIGIVGGQIHTAALRAGSHDLVRPVPSGGLKSIGMQSAPRPSSAPLQQQQHQHSQRSGSASGHPTPMVGLSQMLDAALGNGQRPHSPMPPIVGGAGTPRPVGVPPAATNRRTLLSFGPSSQPPQQQQQQPAPSAPAVYQRPPPQPQPPTQPLLAVPAGVAPLAPLSGPNVSASAGQPSAAPTPSAAAGASVRSILGAYEPTAIGGAPPAGPPAASSAIGFAVPAAGGCNASNNVVGAVHTFAPPAMGHMPPHSAADVLGGGQPYAAASSAPLHFSGGGAPYHQHSAAAVAADAYSPVVTSGVPHRQPNPHHLPPPPSSAIVFGGSAVGAVAEGYHHSSSLLAAPTNFVDTSSSAPRRTPMTFRAPDSYGGGSPPQSAPITAPSAAASTAPKRTLLFGSASSIPAGVLTCNSSAPSATAPSAPAPGDKRPREE